VLDTAPLPVLKETYTRTELLEYRMEHSKQLHRMQVILWCIRIHIIVMIYMVYIWFLYNVC
jgi:hypothetical protein